MFSHDNRGCGETIRRSSKYYAKAVGQPVKAVCQLLSASSPWRGRTYIALCAGNLLEIACLSQVSDKVVMDGAVRFEM